MAALLSMCIPFGRRRIKCVCGIFLVLFLIRWQNAQKTSFSFPFVSVILKLFLRYSLQTQCCISGCFPSSEASSNPSEEGNERSCYLIGEKRGMRRSSVYQSIISTAYQYTFNPIIQIVCIWFYLCLLTISYYKSIIFAHDSSMNSKYFEIFFKI